MPSITLPSKVGYIFSGYYTKEDGQGTKYYNLDGTSATSWNIASNTTLYAYWVANTYTIILDSGDSTTTGTTSIKVTYDSSMPQIILPTKTGYTFKGYYTKEDGQGTQYYNENGDSVKNWTSTSITILYANFAPNTYEVILDNGEVTTEGTTNVTISYDSSMPQIILPTKTGYTFNGYYTKENGQGTKYYDEVGNSLTNWNIASNTTLYAYWTPNTYTITFDKQSGTSGTESVTATYDKEMPEIILPTRTGYTFSGYFTGSLGSGVKYYSEEGNSVINWNLTSDTTLYAYWIPNTYEVTLDNKNATTEGTKKITAIYDEEMPSITLPSRIGYTFKGYFTEEEGQGTQYYTSTGASATNWDSITIKTIYAYWEANTYEVTLDNGEATNTGSTSVTAIYDEEMPSITLPSRVGYTFNGYYTKENGQGTKYYNLDGTSAINWNIASNTTLYANWIANTYTITLDSGDSTTAGSTSITTTYDKEMPNITLPTKTGYTFKGYYSEVSGQGTQYYTSTGTSATKWNSTTITTLYAKWEANTYEVTLDKQNGTGGTDKIDATYDSKLSEIEVPTRTGYTFSGYYSEKSGKGTKYYTSEGISANNWNISSNTTIYAYWIANTYTITLDKQNGTGGTESITATYDEEMPNITLPTREGYTFSGYFTGSLGSGVEYYDEEGNSVITWNLTSNTTLYAYWIANTYTITLDSEESTTSGTTSVTVTYDSSMPDIEKPTKTGYTFYGYYTEKEGSGTKYYDENGQSANKWTITSNKTLYAYWMENDYNVTFDKQNGTGGDTGTTATYNKEMPTITTPTREGYTFSGYFTGTGGSGTKYYESDGTSAKKWDLASVTTLYAYWEANTYTVTFDKQTGTGGTDNVTVTYDIDMPDITIPSKTGYTFLGYFTEKEGNGTQYYTNTGKSITKWNSTTIKTLYANWEVNSYNLTTNIDDNSTLTINRTSSPNKGATTGNLNNGDTIYYGDVLTITFGVTSEAYSIDTHTVNGSSFTSGNTYTVTSNTTVVSSSIVKSYTLTINAETNSTISVTRSSSPNQKATIGNLNNGDTIYYGDVLTITFGVTNEAYSLNAHTLNSTTFTSGNTHTVTSNVSLASSVTVKSYTLTTNIGDNSTITVTRTSSPYGKATTGNLSSEDKIYHGDVLTITFGVSNSTIYSLLTHTVNNETFTSGSTHTVSSDVSISSTAYVNYYTLSTSIGTGSSITINRTSSPNQKATTGNLNNGDTIYYGDVLTITFGVTNEAYSLNTHTLNSTTFTSGSTHTVTSNVSVVSTTTVKSYTLTTNIGDNSTITVTRTSSPYKKATTGNLSSGDKIYHGDVLTITFGVSNSTIYSLLTHTLNNETFTSGSTHTVSSDVSISSTAYVNYYTLSTSIGTGSSITINRTSSPYQNAETKTLTNDDRIYYGDVLTITFGITNEAYSLNTHTVNSATFTSGSTHTVTSNVSVTSSATVKSYTLTTSAGTGSTITVNRTSSPYKKATTGNLSNGDAIYYGDVLTITFGVSNSSIYSIDTHKVNTLDFTSGSSYTVTGAVSVTSSAYVNNYTLIINKETGSTVTVNRTSSPYQSAETKTLSNGDTIYYGDVLTITFGVTNTSVYTINEHKVNSSNFTSGNNYTVSGDVTISSSATINSYTLTTSVGTGSTITVNRTLSPYKDAETGNLSNGDTIYYGDNLTITFGVTDSKIYSINNHKVNSTDFTSGNTYTVTGDVAIVSSATTIPYTINFDKQTGTGGTDNTTATYGSAMPTITIPTRTGYVFQGYFDGTSGSGTQYYTKTGTSKTTWNKTTTPTTLYAYWVANTYTVTLNNQSATTTGSTSVTATYDSDMPTITVPTKSKYIFMGYYSGENGTGTQYYTNTGTSARTWNVSSTSTLYAYWAPNENEVPFTEYMAYKSVMDNTSSTYVTSSSGIDFSKTSSDTNGKGIYELSSTSSDTHPIYYYRGAVTDNNVIYGGYCWKIIRTTDTDGIKMIYNGVPTDGTCSSTGEDTEITQTEAGYNSGFTSRINNDGLYALPYMSGNTSGYSSHMTIDTDYVFSSSVTYDETTEKYTLTGTIITVGADWENEYNSINNTHYTCFSTETTCEDIYYVYSANATSVNSINIYNYNEISTIEEELTSLLDNNTKNSLLKYIIDQWYYYYNGDYIYNANFMDSHAPAYFGDNIEDTVFCNDRSIYDYAGFNSNGGNVTSKMLFGSANRINNGSPSLTCSRNTDKFTTSSANGNGALDYSIALITADEVMLAGLNETTTNTSNYLYTGSGYWTLSPYGDTDDGFSIFIADSDGKLVAELVTDDENDTYNGVRPVISLKSNAIFFTGDGATSSPYELSMILFDSQGGTDGTLSVMTENGMTLPTITPPTRNGYTFQGYYSGTSGSGTKYYNADGSGARTYDLTKTLYAYWTANTYTVTLDNQGATTTGTTSVTATFDSNMPTITVPARENYIFKGYYTGTKGNGIKYYNADGSSATTWNESSNTTLYAYWDLNVNETVFTEYMEYNSSKDNVSSFYVTSSSGIDFSKMSSDTNGKGIYEYTADDLGGDNVYYYRGDVDNNNVIFGGFCWKIIRTTEDNKIKMIYNGTPTDGQCNNISKGIDSGTYFNYYTNSLTSYHSSLAFVGYMYGSVYRWSSISPSTDYVFANDVTYDESTNTYTLTGTTKSVGSSWSWYQDINNTRYTCLSTSTTCTSVYYVYYASSPAYYITLSGGKKIEDALSDMLDNNTNNSNAKNTVDNWYNSNLSETTYEDYINNSTYCSDRSIYDYGGFDPDGGLYSNLSFNSYKRASRGTPSLICSRNIDKLDLKIGLINVDEVMLAGGALNVENTDYYLYTSNTYWTMTPSGISSNEVNLFTQSYYSIYADYQYANNSYGKYIKPVITLTQGVIFTSGDGTTSTPYTSITSQPIVEFDKQGGTGGTYSIVPTTGSAMPSITVPTRENYEFKGYYTGTSGSGTKYYNADGTSAKNWDLSTTTTLYAYWETTLNPNEDPFVEYMAALSTPDTNVDFSQSSSTSGDLGIYEYTGEQDGDETIYYYRGAVTDNNVIFGGFCWKIVRTTETGGIKMIYNGTPTDGTCDNTGTSSQLSTTKAFNSSHNNPAYVGYMYGTTYTYSSISPSTDYVFANDVTYNNGTYTLSGTTQSVGSSWSSQYNIISNTHYTCLSTSSTCTSVYYVYYTYSSEAYYITLSSGKKVEDALSEMLDNNNTSSTIKGSSTTSGTLDYWYYTNLLSSYASYLEDTVFCNDRSIYSYGGWNPDGGSTTSNLYFGAYGRAYSTHIPSLTCSRSTDKFTVSSNLGNGSLDYPVGLLTADEVMLAGGKNGTSNSTYYLYTGSIYWLISPWNWNNANAYEALVNSAGNLNRNIMDFTHGVRPVVSLRPGTIFSSGDGTTTTPYQL